MCVCSLRYPACIAHAPYCHLWAYLPLQILLHYFVNGTVFEETLLNAKCVFWFSLRLSETFLILRRIEGNVIINADGSAYIKYPLLLPDINEPWIFSTDFQKILKYQISWKSIQWEQSCFMWTEGRSDGPHKLKVAFEILQTRLKRVYWNKLHVILYLQLLFWTVCSN